MKWSASGVRNSPVLSRNHQHYQYESSASSALPIWIRPSPHDQFRLKCNTNNQNVIPNIISQRLQVPWKITKFNPMSYTVTPDIALHWFSLETQWNDHDTDCWLFYKGRPPSRSLQGRDYPSAPPLVWWSPSKRGDIWCVKIFLLSKL